MRYIKTSIGADITKRIYGILITTIGVLYMAYLITKCDMPTTLTSAQKQPKAILDGLGLENGENIRSRRGINMGKKEGNGGRNLPYRVI